MRDEGYRYDPALAYLCYGLLFDLFHRELAIGETPAAPGPVEARH
jgi:hypothetical protein